MDEKKIVKQDLNYLEYPNWVLDSRTKLQRLVVTKDYGTYELISPNGLPTHFDKLVLYCVLHKLWHATAFKELSFTTTRYEIATEILEGKATAPYQFERVLKALKKWQMVSISFEGVFYEGDAYTIRYLHIIEDVILNTKTKKLYIKFNEQYIHQLRESKFYKLIDFNEYKRLHRSISARLYEILVKTFKDRHKWHIDIQNLAEKLTIDKRSQAPRYYPSDVLTKLAPALIEINKKTELKINFSYDKVNSICIFSKKEQPIDYEKSIVIQPHTDPILSSLPSYKETLMHYGVSSYAAQQLIGTYSEEKIKEKLDLLKMSRHAVKNVTAWLSKALEEDWQYKAALPLAPKELSKSEQAEKLLFKKTLLEIEHVQYIENRAQEIFDTLPDYLKNSITQEFENWFEQLVARTEFAVSKMLFKKQYIAKILLHKDELDFKQWLITKGHEIE